MAIQPIAAVGREDGEEQQQSSLLAQSLKKQEESRTSLTEMIRDAKEKADAQREKFKLVKISPRYGDAPLEAYARLSRARTPAQAGSAAGDARRRIVQLEAAQRSDPDHADQIKAAVGQLRKAASRAGRKKLELTREQLSRARQKRMARENKRREEQRIKQDNRVLCSFSFYFWHSCLKQMQGQKMEQRLKERPSSDCLNFESIP